ncbi:nucleotide exchange factor GrpE [Methylogaea oryzae]|uniref:Protein GrpE n=1 Tax=Methylogaea oryzae TaxID=1295382 RepID=A0A8D4VRJ2_9GAMM|nr:nucleotide exchange factor GrpE [Methylogaea oryzae]BBL71080.1 protein GrpE [Methylogaea oryzae]
MNSESEQQVEVITAAEEENTVIDAAAEAPAEAQTDVAALTEELAQANRRADENWDKLLRLQAEMENLRRRTEKDLDSTRKFALERFAKELLPVIDSLELGIQASTSDNPEVVKLREGSELTLKQLTAVLERFNVLVVDPQGEKFNPELHQAMAVDPSAPGEANTVVKVFQKGYVLNDRLLRPAMVVIAQGGVEAPRVDEEA